MSYLLFADDDPHMRGLVRDVLEVVGHEVALVPNGRAALDALQQREPDLLLLDRSMPGLSGIEVCRAVKQNPFLSHIPVLMLTGESHVDRKLEGYEAGADDYLAKPFDSRELRARVEVLLRLVRREADRNPTSLLPGGRAIQDEIERRLARRELFAVCYVDLDHFKPFADTFGFSVADEVIRQTGRALREACAVSAGAGDFAGHIGGDDFILVTAPDRAQSLVGECVRRFRDVVARVLGPSVVARETFSGVDRDGTPREFPIARLSAATVPVDPAQWVSFAHVGAQAAEAKRKAKQRGGTTGVDAG